MKTKNQKESKIGKFLKIFLFFGIVSIIIMFALNSESSLGEKYTIHSSDSEYGSEVSYINLTGERTIEDKKIKLSEGYWTSGRFDF